MNNVKELLQELVGVRKEYAKNLDIAKVISVDKSKNLCTVLLIKEDVIMNNVLLSVSETATYVAYPAVDSIIIIGYLDSLNPIAIMFSDVEQVVEGVVTNDLTVKVLLDFMVESNKTLMSDLFDALKQAVWNTSAGPTVPSPQNQVIFDQILQKYKDDLDQTSDYIKNIYFK